jgi:hypothetical protein
LLSNRHQTACLATEGLHPPPLLTAMHCVNKTAFAMLRVLICFHSPELRCSCCDDVRFCCDLEACNLVTAAVVIRFKIRMDLISLSGNRQSSGSTLLLPMRFKSKIETGSNLKPTFQFLRSLLKFFFLINVNSERCLESLFWSFLSFFTLIFATRYTMIPAVRIVSKRVHSSAAFKNMISSDCRILLVLLWRMFHFH